MTDLSYGAAGVDVIREEKALAGLVGWARRTYTQLPLTLQAPLLANINRHEFPIGIRVPQSGILHQPTADEPKHQGPVGNLRNTYKRTHRWDKVLRDQDELVVAEMNLDMIEEVRRTWQFFRDRRPESYEDLVKQLP